MRGRFRVDPRPAPGRASIGIPKRRKTMRTLVIAAIVVAASTGTALAQDAAAGEQVFKRLCSPCHDIGPEAKVKLGPPLNAVDGRKAGTFEGFNYSPANKSSGITWSAQAFDKYIRAPMQEMPGTRMAFVALKMTRTIGDLGPYPKNSGPTARRNESAAGCMHRAGLRPTVWFRRQLAIDAHALRLAALQRSRAGVD